MKRFQSKFAQYMQGMILHQEALGYSSGSYEYYLRRFDKFCYTQFPDADILTQELMQEWLKTLEYMHLAGLVRYLAAMRMFARYLRSVGLQAYILPPKMTGYPKKPPVYIYSEAELKSFFHGADHVERSARDPLNHYIVPLIFRLIYCCGLRPEEGRLIRIKDIDLNTGKLYIREAKRHKDRLVVLTDDLCQLCRLYMKKREEHTPNSEYLFPDRNGNVRNNQWLNRQFRKCWKNAGIEYTRKPFPRIYDFRHTFATNRLHEWMDQKEDLYYWLPYLSSYMGHVQFSTTAYYIHLIPERLTASTSIDWLSFANLMPEVPR